jgi:hypothetical protein
LSEKQEDKKSVRFNLSSKFWKTFLIVFAVLLLFAGPTYVVYVLQRILDVNYYVSMGSGLVLFIVGLGLLWYLVKNRVIS